MIDERGIEVCDVCATWVATHTFTSMSGCVPVTYRVCDKPRCQDAVGEFAIADDTEEKGASRAGANKQ